ncbi:uncharacterized protein DDB_G0284459-like [Argiope bruennichi]|uniref:uncharacterized protein DDB_G0284459-like n=1 Tax=Argiope bruennichi TaxID=94029 RepID=UPI0024950A0A|nr:uncharacterized protein DDB_G0284459-like [Argiope bruennichi]
MWKKLKGGRRQILQLEEKKRPKDSSKSKVKSLIHYSDSDDDSKKSNESESSSSSTAQTKNAAPLESQIADFFKEIDALSVPEEILKDTDKITSTCKTENVKDHTPKTCSSDAAVHLQASTYREDSHSVAPNTYCPWQEICDSSTGYNYYWNVQTNEVTWDCPPEYAAYVRSFNEVTEKAIPASQNDKNTDGTEKKKKNNIVVPEGAIIPISYFGDSSSSDNSSDSESEATNKNTKFEKLYEINKNKTVEKVDSTSKSNEAEVSEVKGPSFPHCYQFPHSESVKKETDSQMTISQNPVSEVVKIDSSLPLKTLNDITETPSQSILDELPAESSTHEASWKNSLKDAEKKSVQLNEKAGDESPDSSVNKEENSLSHNAYQVINNTYGFRPVVDYDSFTDEEEEISVASISSSKPNEDKKNCEIKSSSQQEQENITESATKLFIGAQNKISSFKRKASEVLTESTKNEELIKKPKRNDVNIDSLFSSHSSYGKYGFGFGWKKPVDEQNDELFTTGTQSNRTRKHKSEFKKVNFIKSEDILDLKTLNNETNQALVDEPVLTNTECGRSIVSEQNEKPLRNNEELLEIAPAKENVKISSDCDVDSSSIISIKDKIDFSMLSKKRKNTKSIFNAGTTSLKIDDDLDEIDKALCEALDAKKSSKKAFVKSASPVSDVPNTSKNMVESTTSVGILQEAEPVCKDAVDTDALTDEILEISSEVIDKVTFLLTAPSTHASFNGVFFQLQTRFVDWQAGALDSTYFMARLKELEQYIQHYEMSVISGDWTCKWDRVNKRYFFTNIKTQNSQWTYPEEICNEDKPSSVQRKAESAPLLASSFASERDDLQTVSSSSTAHENFAYKSFAPESKDNSSGSRWILQCSPPPPPPDTPPPLPHTPPPESPPPPPKSPPPQPKSHPMPPPDSTETLREPEDMDIENSNDSSSFLFVTNRRIIDGKERGVDNKEGSTYYVNMPDGELKKNSTSYASYVRLIEDLSTTKGGYDYLMNLSKSSRSRPYSLDNSEVNSVHWSRPSCNSQEKIDLNSAGSKSTITEIPANLTSVITEIPANLTSAITEIPANLTSTITEVPANLTSAITEAPANLTSAITEAPANLTLVTEVPANLTSAVIAVPTNLTSAITEVSLNLTSAITEVSLNLTSAITEVPANLTSIITEVPANLIEEKNSDTLHLKITKPGSAVSKKEKKKAKIQLGLGLKKKNLPSLVEKWQKIKEEQIREDSIND